MLIGKRPRRLTAEEIAERVDARQGQREIDALADTRRHLTYAMGLLGLDGASNEDLKRLIADGFDQAASAMNVGQHAVSAAENIHSQSEKQDS